MNGIIGFLIGVCFWGLWMAIDLFVYDHGVVALPVAFIFIAGGLCLGLMIALALERANQRAWNRRGSWRKRNYR